MECYNRGIKVVIAHSIRRKEFGHASIAQEDLETILQSFTEGIFTPLKGDALPRGSRLIKIYATTAGGAKRIVFLVDVATGTGFFLMYRGKNDAIGRNISIKNPAFRARLHTYLSLLDADIGTKNFTMYEA